MAERPIPQLIAADFAKSAPVGSDCLYYPRKPFIRSDAVKTRILSEPWVLGHGAVVVKIDGVRGGVSIEHIAFDPAPPRPDQ